MSWSSTLVFGCRQHRMFSEAISTAALSSKFWNYPGGFITQHLQIWGWHVDRWVPVQSVVLSNSQHKPNPCWSWQASWLALHLTQAGRLLDLTSGKVPASPMRLLRSALAKFKPGQELGSGLIARSKLHCPPPPHFPPGSPCPLQAWVGWTQPAWDWHPW